MASAQQGGVGFCNEAEACVCREMSFYEAELSQQGINRRSGVIWFFENDQKHRKIMIITFHRRSLNVYPAGTGVPQTSLSLFTSYLASTPRTHPPRSPAFLTTSTNTRLQLLKQTQLSKTTDKDISLPFPPSAPRLSQPLTFLC